MRPGGGVAVRPAAPGDEVAAVALMRQLAEWEGHASSFAATPDRLADGLFGEVPGLRCWVAERGDAIMGVALCATTWTGVTCRPSLRLLNLVVAAGARGAGTGTALVRAVVAACVQLDCALDWMVRADNVGAQGFYAGLGAERREGWQVWQLAGDAMRRLASHNSASAP
jgi:ribosomal protein S18 acetylase RimI-like enzyme